jgi:hypothetical protein
MSDLIAALARDEIRFRIWSPEYAKYLFVSNDAIAGDNLLEAHARGDDPRNKFIVQDVGDGRYRIFNPVYGYYLFISRDKKGKDHVVEAHARAGDDRGYFTFEPAGGDRFRISNPYYDLRYLFVSNDTKAGDNVVEAHRATDEPRNVFQILPDPNYRRWMELTPGVLDQPLKHVCLPATHDSGTWKFSEYLVKSRDTNAYRKYVLEAQAIAREVGSVPLVGKKMEAAVQKILHDVVWSTIDGLSSTTRRTVATQLAEGIRCLDLRVFYNARTGKLHTWHGAQGPELEGILDDVRAFLASTSSELVYITMGHFQGFDHPHAWDAFRGLVTSKLGGYAYLREDDASGAVANNPFEATLRLVLSQGGALRSRAILVGTSEKLKDAIFFPAGYSPPDNDESGTVIAGFYTETTDRREMLDTQAAQFRQAGGLPFALYLTLTPSASDDTKIFTHNAGRALQGYLQGVPFVPALDILAQKLVAAWTRPWTTLLQLSAIANADMENTLTGTFQPTQAVPNAITFIYTDFYYTTPVVDLAIAYSTPAPSATAA